jgi:hypothetical protein
MRATTPTTAPIGRPPKPSIDLPPADSSKLSLVFDGGGTSEVTETGNRHVRRTRWARAGITAYPGVTSKATTRKCRTRVASVPGRLGWQPGRHTPLSGARRSLAAGRIARADYRTLFNSSRIAQTPWRRSALSLSLGVNGLTLTSASWRVYGTSGSLRGSSSLFASHLPF